jgi:hypothetical protein
MTLIIVVLSSLLAWGRVKLVTLPERERVTIHLDNPQATLVEEERILTLQKGQNHIDFSWKGVRIDPDSIRLHICSHPEQVSLIAVSYPPQESALVWNIYSQAALEEKVRISYLLDGIDRLVTYQALTDVKETEIDLKSSLVLRNFSGEHFHQAACLLGYNLDFTTGIRHRETKKRSFLQRDDLSIKKTLTWDAAKHPHDPEKVQGNVGIPVHYVLKNNQDSGLGQHPLWKGKIRIFQEDGHGSTIFLGEDRVNLTPVGDKMKIAIGDSRDVVVTQRRLASKRTNIRRNDKGDIEVYDKIIHDKATIENFKDTPVTLTLIEHFHGQWDPIEFSHEYTKRNHSKIEFRVDIPAGQQTSLQMRYTQQNIFAKKYQKFNRIQ